MKNEKRQNEVFLGNTDKAEIPAEFAGLSTYRIGTQASDIDGKPLPLTYRPTFVGRSEAAAHDKIAMKRFRGIRGY